jgi:hypothetical protein
VTCGWRIRAIVVATVALATGVAAQPAGEVRRFNGTWQVALVCPTTPQGAQGFTFVFPATVNDGHLHGQYGTMGRAPSLTYDGTIQPDGRATVAATGLTGNPDFNVAQVQKGVPYGYHFIAQFEGAHGHGTKTEIRPCEVDFVRQ